MNKVLTIIGVIGLVIVGILNVSTWVTYKSGCGDNLALAADASTMNGAYEKLNLAIQYMELHNLTGGNSAFFFRTPRNNLGIWYQQRKEGLAGLARLIEQKAQNPSSVMPVDESNELMKLKDLLKDNGSVTEPQHIDVFPAQGAYLFGYIVFGLLLIVGGVWWFVEYTNF